MKYRIRMEQRQWFVRQYAPDGSHVADHGPYVPCDYHEAVKWANAQGWSDWDRMETVR